MRPIRHYLWPMCSRYSLTTPIEAVRQLFAFSGGVPYPARYNIAPTQPVAILRLRPGVEATGERELALVRWGLIPRWVKDPRVFATVLNARAETALEKPSFKAAMRHRRCIVPADAFYEWTGKPRAKTAHLIRPRADVAGTQPMAFAGLWENWLGADGSEMESMAIITVAASGVVGEIHDRMPAILNADQVADWLDVRGIPEDQAWSMLAPAADNLLERMEVSKVLNNWPAAFQGG
jgi:putative SOS response-associated peptidase YedK